MVINGRAGMNSEGQNSFTIYIFPLVLLIILAEKLRKFNSYISHFRASVVVIAIMIDNIVINYVD